MKDEGFEDRQTDERTDIGDCRVAFATEKIEIGFHLTNFRNLLQEVNFLNFLTHGKREGVNENIIL